VAEETTYRLVSAIWLGSSVWFAIFSFRFTRRLRATSETSLAIDASGNALYLLFFGVAALQAVNAASLGSFWPAFAAFFFHLLSASSSFYRLMFLSAR